jgi:Spy/CpxP family protein refolding chaperone
MCLGAPSNKMFKVETTICAAVAALCVLANGSQCAFAKDDSKSQPSPPNATSATSGAGEVYGSHLEPILKTVTATVEQRKQITLVVEDFRPRIEPLQVKWKEKQSQFLNTMTTGRPAEEIMVKQNELNELYSQISNEYFMMHLKIRKVLTPAQCEKYESYRRRQGWHK